MLSPCRCVVDQVIKGADAAAYARSHLADIGSGEPSDDSDRVDIGSDESSEWDRFVQNPSEWACLETGALWHGNIWRDSFQLRRRPVTSLGDYLDASVVATRASEINNAEAEVYRWFKVDAAQHEMATQRLWRAMEALYSPHWYEIVESLRMGDPVAAPAAVVFMEVDPHCHRSGYEKEVLCRYLARMRLTSHQQERLAAAAMAAVLDPRKPGRELRRWQRLLASLSSRN